MVVDVVTHTETIRSYEHARYTNPFAESRAGRFVSIPGFLHSSPSGVWNPEAAKHCSLLLRRSPAARPSNFFARATERKEREREILLSPARGSSERNRTRTGGDDSSMYMASSPDDGKRERETGCAGG